MHFVNLWYSLSKFLNGQLRSQKRTLLMMYSLLFASYITRWIYISTFRGSNDIICQAYYKWMVDNLILVLLGSSCIIPQVLVHHASFKADNNVNQLLIIKAKEQLESAQRTRSQYETQEISEKAFSASDNEQMSLE
jgi:hypothetical protein